MEKLTMQFCKQCGEEYDHFKTSAVDSLSFCSERCETIAKNEEFNRIQAHVRRIQRDKDLKSLISAIKQSTGYDLPNTPEKRAWQIKRAKKDRKEAFFIVIASVILIIVALIAMPHSEMIGIPSLFIGMLLIFLSLGAAVKQLFFKTKEGILFSIGLVAFYTVFAYVANYLY